MKKYMKPTVSVVEIQAKENIAGNPIDKAAIDPLGDPTRTTTVYNLALFGENSAPQGT